MKGAIAIIGCGYWGKNLVRNFCQLLGPHRVVCCDMNPQVIREITAQYPKTRGVNNVEDLWNDEDIEAVVVATPTITHYRLARKALLEGKHVFVEKPMTTSGVEAADLCDVAQAQNRVLMVDHLLLFHPAFRELERLVAAGDLGSIYHLYSRRTNMGIVRSEENALWSLGPHDIALILRLLCRNPVTVAAQGGSYLQSELGIQDVVFLTLVFPEGQLAHLHLSWHDPQKARELTVVGSRKAAVFDDMNPTEKLRMYEYEVGSGQSVGQVSIGNLRSQVLPTSQREPLSLVCEEFLASVKRGTALESDGKTGLDVVRVLEAAQLSLQQNGTPIALD